MSRLSRMGDKTFKRELALAFALIYLSAIVDAMWFSSVEQVTAITPLLTGLGVPILGFVAAAAGIHYMKPKMPKGAE